MRQSLSLVGAMFATPAAAADTKATKPVTALPAKPTAATAATDTSKATTTATARTDPAAIAALTADAGGDPVLTAEPPAPTADLRFDAMLADRKSTRLNSSH